MFFKKYKLLFISFFIFVIGLSIDQFTKNYAINTIQNLEKKTNYMHRHIPIFKGFNLVLAKYKESLTIATIPGYVPVPLLISSLSS